MIVRRRVRKLDWGPNLDDVGVYADGHGPGDVCEGGAEWVVRYYRVPDSGGSWLKVDPATGELVDATEYATLLLSYRKVEEVKADEAVHAD
jgi:hypothetical protein